MTMSGLNVKEIGRMFAGAVRKTADSAALYTKSVFSAYDINRHRLEKKRISIAIGQRVTQLIDEGNPDISTDAELLNLFSALNIIEKDIAEYEQSRSTLLNPFTTKKPECHCTTHCEEKE